MKNPVYAIGDIHGELAMLKDAIAKIEMDGGADASVVFLGDYVDRGAHSREVIEFLINGQREARNWRYLLGNHDRMFSMFMEDYPRNDVRLPIGYYWLHDRLGGRETLASYGVNVADRERMFSVHNRARDAVPSAHVEFLRSLHYFHQQDDLLFVHAGIRPGVPFDQQEKDDLIWIRKEFIEDKRSHPWLVVHGHTTVPEAQHFGNRVSLDTGAGYGEPLTTAVFEGTDCWLLTDAGRTPLLPQR